MSWSRGGSGPLGPTPGHAPEEVIKNPIILQTLRYTLLQIYCWICQWKIKNMHDLIQLLILMAYFYGPSGIYNPIRNWRNSQQYAGNATRCVSEALFGKQMLLLSIKNALCPQRVKNCWCVLFIPATTSRTLVSTVCIWRFCIAGLQWRS